MMCWLLRKISTISDKDIERNNLADSFSFKFYWMSLKHMMMIIHKNNIFLTFSWTRMIRLYDFFSHLSIVSKCCSNMMIFFFLIAHTRSIDFACHFFILLMLTIWMISSQLILLFCLTRKNQTIWILFDVFINYTIALI